jgi:hypothetical protein
MGIRYPVEISSVELSDSDGVELGKPLPQPDPDASDPDADLIEVVPVSITAGA